MKTTENVVRYLREMSYRSPDKTALVESESSGDRAWSFGELEARADWMATGLRAEGIEAGDRVIVMVPMSLKLYQVLLALLELGAIAVFVDPWIGAQQIATFASYADPKGFVGVAKSHLVRLFDGDLRTLPVSVTTGERIFCIPARRSWLEVERYEGPQRLAAVDGDDTALITFTSGSSGMPKGADRTHRFLAAQHEALNAEFPYREDDVDMPTFPVFSLNNLANGVPTVIPDIDFRQVAQCDGRRILEQMEEHGVTTATASPPFFDRLCDALEAGARPRVSLRRVLTGGAPVSDEQLRRWQRVMPDTEIVVIYGSTEAEPVAHIGATDRLAARRDDSIQQGGFCVGEPIEALAAKVIPIRRKPLVLVDDDWSKLALDKGEVGELVVSGDHVCERYFRNAEATAENKIVEDSGRVWHRMGDTGYFDDQGRFWLTGRVHSTILRGSQRVQAQVVEQAAAEDDARIARVAAVGMPDEVLGERVVVAVECKVEGQRDEILNSVAGRLERADLCVDAILAVDTPIPVDPRHNAKVDYGALRRRLEDLDELSEWG